MTLLEIDTLSLETRSAKLLRGVSVAVQPGQVVGIVGESGAGKSMLGRAVLGILPRDVRVAGGAIRLKGEDLLGLSWRQRRLRLKRDLALIPQDPLSALNPCRTIEAQIGEILRTVGVSDVSGEVVRRLDAVRIPAAAKVANSYPHELSGGMRQRVLIAGAFASKPSIVIADEPTTALDVTVQKEVLRLIEALQHETGVGLLFITHDLCVVAKICDQVTVMHGGRVIEQSDCQRLLAHPSHAYSSALVAATPRHDVSDQVLQPVAPSVIEDLIAETKALDG
ncbi:MAG: ABC transporter ATP-binding protein [Pseudomonadota bacterium]